MMKPIEDYFLITPDDLQWRHSNIMKIPNADFLERTGSENLAARLWRLPPKSANTLHKHIRPEEFYFVLEGMGRIRTGKIMLRGFVASILKAIRRTRPAPIRPRV